MDVRDETGERGDRVELRVSHEERVLMEREAGRQNMTLSAYLRAAAMGQVRYAEDHTGQIVSRIAGEIDARVRALVEVIAEQGRTLMEAGGQSLGEAEGKAEVARLLRWYASAVEDHLRRGRGT